MISIILAIALILVFIIVGGVALVLSDVGENSTNYLPEELEELAISHNNQITVGNYEDLRRDSEDEETKESLNMEHTR